MDATGPAAWTSQSWLDDAAAWIRDRVDDAGMQVIGEVDQARVRPWSTQLTAPTDAGLVWFKAVCPSMAHEPALTQSLTRLLPGRVVVPLAIDIRRGWMLTLDGGRRLDGDGDGDEPGEATWTELVASYAHDQQILGRHAVEVLATGVPTALPRDHEELLAGLIDRYSLLPSDHDSHLGLELRTALEARRAHLRAASALLDGSEIGQSLDHGDLHPGNVLTRRGGARRRRLIDFSDATWGHPFSVLDGVMDPARTGLDAEAGRRVIDAYLGAWPVPRGDARELAQAAIWTANLVRARLWIGVLEATPREHLGPWGPYGLGCLRAFARRS